MKPSGKVELLIISIRNPYSHATVPHIVALLGFHLPPSHLGNSSELDCSRFVVGWLLLSRCKDRQKWLIFQINPRLFSVFFS
jgi:hypothetical protein